MRLKDITKPFLRSNLSVLKFSKGVGLSAGHVSQIIRKDLSNISTYRSEKVDCLLVPIRESDRVFWLRKIAAYESEIQRLGLNGLSRHEIVCECCGHIINLKKTYKGQEGK